ncbi:MAG: hypothetical protein WAK52_08725 [Trichococcus sp.]
MRAVQSLSGKKIEIYSLPYSSINMWSTEHVRTLIRMQKWNCGRALGTSK